MSKFTHLHVHSHYSLLDGLGTIPNLIKHAQSLDMDSLALTDHGVLFGAVEFSKTAKKAGVKPIIGCELYIAPRTIADKVNRIDTSPYHLIVLCKNKIGYQNLLKLVTTAHLEGYYYKPRVDKHLLKRYGEGLICMTSCLQGEVSKAASENDLDKASKSIKEYLEIFGEENLYLEMQHHPELPRQVISNKNMVDLAKKHNLPLIATNDVHYLKYEDAEAQDALLCIQTGRLMEEPDRMTMKENGKFIDISMKSTAEMSDNFNDTPEAISNSQLIVNKCEFELELGRYIFPAFPLPDKTTPDQFLKEECIRGFYEKVLKIENTSDNKEYPKEASKEYTERVEYELSIIAKTGFASYMLMVADYTNEANKRGIFTNTRGSAAGSLVAYLTGITNVDPMPYNLFFERFLNPERISWPDVDLDIADVRRGELIEYVTGKYGVDKVAQIITFGTIAAKNSIRDVGRVLGMPYSEVDAISKLISLGQTLQEALDTSAELKQRYQTEPAVARIIDLAKKIEGVARHASVHAAGVVISDKPLEEYVPLQRVKEESGIVTQYPMYDLEAVGLVKMDFLGLANLTIIEHSLDIIHATKQVEIKTAEIPLDDKETYELLSRGDSSGVFQLESDGMKRYLKELKPTEINDIIAMVALYRPGPIELIPDYINGKHGKKRVTYLHPKLEPILKGTYGIAVYQEQILQIARELCGFTYGEADVLRKAIGKKNKELLLEQRNKWIEKAQTNGIDKALSEKLFDFVEPFARYGFNKAHATSYGMIAYQTAYLKAHYPSQFMAAWLTSEQSRDMDKVSFALQECEQMGIKVLPPDVNESFANFGVVTDKETGAENIRFGLGAIKNVGYGVAVLIVQERKENGPFKSLTDFVQRLDPKVINRKTIESLAQTGAFDRFEERNAIMLGMEVILKYSQVRNQANTAQIGLFDLGSGVEELASFVLPQTAPATKQQKLQWEKELLGIYISEHPLTEIRSKLGVPVTSLNQVTEEMIGRTIRVMGIVTTAKQITTKSNQSMAFVKIEDTTANLEVIVFPNLFAETKTYWEADHVLIADGKVDNKDGSMKILANAAWDITGQENLSDLSLPEIKHDNGGKQKGSNGNSSYRPTARTIAPQVENHLRVLEITIPKGSKVDLLATIKKTLEEFEGDSTVILRIPSNGDFKEIRAKILVDVHPPLIHALENIIGEEYIKIK
jgi:DNA polymerase-3 subunit alpha